MSMFDILRKALLAGIGAQEKVKELVDELIKKGELSESEGAKLVKEWTEKAEKSTDTIAKTVSETVRSTIERLRLPSKEEIEKINEKIDDILRRLERLEKREE